MNRWLGGFGVFSICHFRAGGQQARPLLFHMEPVERTATYASTPLTYLLARRLTIQPAAAYRLTNRV